MLQKCWERKLAAARCVCHMCEFEQMNWWLFQCVVFIFHVERRSHCSCSCIHARMQMLIVQTHKLWCGDCRHCVFSGRSRIIYFWLYVDVLLNASKRWWLNADNQIALNFFSSDFPSSFSSAIQNFISTISVRNDKQKPTVNNYIHCFLSDRNWDVRVRALHLISLPISSDQTHTHRIDRIDPEHRRIAQTTIPFHCPPFHI